MNLLLTGRNNADCLTSLVSFFELALLSESRVSKVPYRGTFETFYHSPHDDASPSISNFANSIVHEV